jgi:ATP-binding cassette subfamily B protein
MPARHSSSRRRFIDYTRQRAAAQKPTGEAATVPHIPGTGALPGAKPKRKRSFLVLLATFWRELRGWRPLVILALTTLSIGTVVSLIMPAATKFTLDYVLSDHPGPAGIPKWVPVPTTDRHQLLWLVGGVTIFAAIISIAVGMSGRWQMTRLTKRVQAAMRKKVFDHAVKLPLHRIYQLKSGGAASILRDDASQAGELLFSMIYNPWRAIIQLIGTLAILATVDWRLLGGALLLLPVVWVSNRTWIGRVRPMHMDARATRQGIDAHATEAFGGMRVVRGFSREKGESARFTRGHHFLARQEIRIWWWSRIIEVAWMVFIPTATAGVLVYGGTQVLSGRLTIGDLMMFMTYVVMLLGPLETLTSTATNIQNNLAGFDRVLDLLEEPVEFHESLPAPGEAVYVDRQTAAGRVTLRDITFAYPAAPKDPPREPVIRGVTLDVQPGEMIAFVGPSGSGKTTLCNLIARFFDPTSGQILFDGTDLKKIDVASYRRLLGIVEQDVFLFDGTVAENIGYSRRGATTDDIVAAAKAANADEFIRKLEKGYDTVIGERGVRLSGGQKQRVAIARALLADPLILILDEATSNLDSESEALIQRSLARLLRGRTSFVIAHRLSTIRNADRIVVLEDGRVIETGTHEELLASGGRYADFLRLQVEGSSEDEEAQQDLSPRPA